VFLALREDLGHRGPYSSRHARGDLPAARILVRPDGYVRWATDDSEAEVPEFARVSELRVTIASTTR
jgi:hypothetical protein